MIRVPYPIEVEVSGSTAMRTRPPLCGQIISVDKRCACAFDGIITGDLRPVTGGNGGGGLGRSQIYRLDLVPRQCFFPLSVLYLTAPASLPGMP